MNPELPNIMRVDRDNMVKLLKDRYCSSVAYCQLYVIVVVFFLVLSIKLAFILH